MDRPVNYEQTDSRWKNVVYSAGGDRDQTIGLSGCGPTCAAMVLATLRDKDITPVQTCAWAAAHGYRIKNDGTKWAYFAAQCAEYGISVRQTGDVEQALSALLQGYLVITAASKGIWTSSGHFILAYGYDQAAGKVSINDPNSAAAYRELADVSKYRSQTVQYFIIEEAWTMSYEQFKQYMDQYLDELAQEPPSENWGEEERAWAESSGIIKGDSTGKKQYKAFCTREQMVTFLYRLFNLLRK